ncbi:2-octaprenyl-3-methyl-6-methoxy-1,4-benzoquinol hydroxylase [Achromobacter sp. HZ01]|jgi:ubiquinone biosynthesis monooxygenase Coq7|uniref:2-polyprenyl-3-methyl-6-methoxy-1,4-benzoquinone monooxygenase n=1 Tax=Achromobacter sp. HZ01 TaxID=1416886 RepID=UPI000DC29D9C|nr:2-polyprenyl-3-methyl-6-methoxy-1,4-benzoquinone monooxygenase [Achromobacter sp. HZ01]MBO9327541.1 2-polyprenyl-3-methyl-6-methoxy-1,4-benzoquinone monooxygenase [Achromobacter xylosoxidans]RAP63128.1 2-octaprenyl-3-methyl-6-methoxy-1,4-benzoquinol hydroxylase [Achromobacter sp. HZ01]
MSTALSRTGPAFLRRTNPLDAFLAEADRALRVLSGSATAGRSYPATAEEAPQALSAQEKRHAAGLMRVNHVGEVCAQALYRGQASVCREPAPRELLLNAAAEEVDHLVWCNQRLTELGSRPSLLNPFWYAGSFALGVLASYAGVPRNLGFMAETEKQVEAHLDGHLRTLPVQDERSRQIVQKMKDDEAQHRASAEQAGGVPLPLPARAAMKAMSKVMTSTAYWI